MALSVRPKTPVFEKVTVLLVAIVLLPLVLLTVSVALVIGLSSRTVRSSFAVMMPEKFALTVVETPMVLRPEEPARTMMLLRIVKLLPICNVAEALPLVSPNWMVGPVAPPRALALVPNRSVPALTIASPPTRPVLAPVRSKRPGPALVKLVPAPVRSELMVAPALALLTVMVDAAANVMVLAAVPTVSAVDWPAPKVILPTETPAAATATAALV